MCDLDGQVSWFDQDTWFGKTYLEPLAPTEEKTSESSLKKSAKSQTRLPLFLDLRKNGAMRDASWEMGGALLGEYTTPSFGESPREENVSRLSQILEEQAPQKYCLSAKACQGILNRAERRGKELPKELKEALENQCLTETLRAQDHGHAPLVLVYDARGNGRGRIVPTITGDHQNRITDYTAVVIRYDETIQ